MMKKSKHKFHCEHCEAECMIYRKGKNHRVLVCPNCGVLATNGKGIGKKIVKRGAKALIGEIPGASAIMEGVGLLSDIKGGKATKQATPKTKYDNLDKPNYGERVINRELYGV